MARHAGLRVLGLSLITNVAAMEDGDEFDADHASVLKASTDRAQTFQLYVSEIVSKIQ